LEVQVSRTPLSFRNYPLVAVFFTLVALGLTSKSVIAQEEEPYRVLPGDQLLISVWKEEGLERITIVRPDGGMTFPLAGEIQASGKTIAEITDEISIKLSPYIPEALVTVGVSEIRGARLYIIGQFQQSGVFFVNPAVDVMQALSMAGGLSAFASADDIRILRRDGNGQVAIPFEYNQILRGRELEQNIMLQDGDVLIVP
jgi:polysaccharide export outer membrane protein